MALLDRFFDPTGGLYALLLQQQLQGGGPPAWQPLQQGPEPGPSLRYDPNGPGSMVDLRGGGSLMAPPGPQRVPIPAMGGGGPGPEQFSQLSGFGISPGSTADVPVPRAMPPRSVRPLPDPLVISDLPPAAQPTSGLVPYKNSARPDDEPAPERRGLPPVARDQYQQAPPQQSQYQPPPGPGVGDRLTAGFANILNRPFSPYGLFEGAQGFATGQRTDAAGAWQQMVGQTEEALVASGMPRPQARLVAQNPEAQKLVFERMFAQPKFEKVGPGEAAYLVGGGGIGGRTNVQQLTAGMSPEELAAQRAAGETRGKAAASLPSTMATADQALNVIDQLQNHPGKKYAIGKLGFLPAISGTPQGDFVALNEQAQGQLFLQAYAQLKGGGAISEAEGAKAQTAIGRLQRAQSPEAYDAALNELRGVITAGRANAQRIAGGQTQGYAAPTPIGGGWTTVTTPNGPARIRERK